MTLVLAWWDGKGINMIGDCRVTVAGGAGITSAVKVRKKELNTGPLLMGCSGDAVNLMVVEDIYALDSVVFSLNGTHPTMTSICMAIIEHLKDHPLLHRGDGHLIIAFGRQVAIVDLEHLTCRPSFGYGIIGNPLVAYGALRALHTVGRGVVMSENGQSLVFTRQGLSCFLSTMTSDTVGGGWAGFITSEHTGLTEVPPTESIEKCLD